MACGAKLSSSLIRFLVAGPILFLGLASAPAALASGQKKCDCSHLSVLQAELRNALRLQAAFRGNIEKLRQEKGTLASQAAHKRFAETEARKGLEPVPGANVQSEVDYVPYGEGVSPELFGDNTPERNRQLCAMRPSSAADLDRAASSAACSGIGDSLRAHEDVHRKMCESVGYRTYLNMHGADRAQEEVDAYAAQIAVLRREIARVLMEATIRVQVHNQTRTSMANNPLWTAIDHEIDARLEYTPASQTSSQPQAEAVGRQDINVSIEGHCSINSKMPISLQARGKIDASDGLHARIDYHVEGTIPQIGMKCTLPGQGSGYGFSMPVPAGSDGRAHVVEVDLRDGAEAQFDMADAEAAQMLGSAGVRMTGKGKYTLRLICPAH